MTRCCSITAALVLCLAFAGCAPARPVPQLRLRTEARHYMAGQEFLIEVSSSAPLPARDRIWVRLARANGPALWRDQLSASKAGFWRLAGDLPRAGAYRLTAEVAGATRPLASLDLEAVTPPPPFYGGVLPVAAYGFPDALMQALRARGFALRSGLGATHPRLIAVAEPKLPGPGLAARYRRIWSAVAQGANLLLLSPPAPDMAPYWPFRIHVLNYSAACGAPFPEGLPALRDGLPSAATAVLRPDFAYDLSREPEINLLTPDLRLLVRAPGGAGYAGCHAWFRFRFGRGLVTVSSVPIIAHAEDAYTQRYLMNLLKLAAQPVRRGRPAYGLAAAFQRRLAALPPAAK